MLRGYTEFFSIACRVISFCVCADSNFIPWASIGREFAENVAIFVLAKGGAYYFLQISSRVHARDEEMEFKLEREKNLKFERRRNFERQRKIDDSGSKTKNVGRQQLKIA
jgi:hypothetical protein